MAKKKRNQQARNGNSIEIGHATDVEYSAEMADANDMEANQRAEEANQRALKRDV